MTYNTLNRKAGKEPLPPRPGEKLNSYLKIAVRLAKVQDGYFLWVYVSISTISKATDTTSCSSSYVLIGTTSDRLGTGAARPPASRLSILYCHGSKVSYFDFSGVEGVDI